MVSAGVMSEAETTNERPRDGAGWGARRTARGVGTRDPNNPEDDDEDDARSARAEGGEGGEGARARGRETREATTRGRDNARDAPRGDAANVAIARDATRVVARVLREKRSRFVEGDTSGGHRTKRYLQK